jgi:BMFP domain-containing protein YqiC
MQTENRLFDDLAKVATGALGALGGVREEIEARLREQLERILDRMNLVRREEFDAVQAMAQKARAAQEALEQRVAALEARLATQPAPGEEMAGAPLRSRPATKRAKAPPESE